jgi:hypothetical protein
VRLLSIFISIFFLFGCEKKPEVAFYYWQSSCKIDKDFKYPIYLKVLDIGVKKVIKTSCKQKFTPVVYIENEALKKRDDIYKLITKIVPKDVKELQIDCDWTLSTKKKYFKLLKSLHDRYHFLTVTIRLHQVKFFKKTGVPPADCGVLMFYNMSDFLDPKTKNYILDLKEAKKYLVNFDKYPLKLDLALPLYSQAVVIRYGKVIKLIEGVRKKDMDEKFFIHLKENRYKTTKTHYLKGSLVYEGDVVRVDEVDYEQLKKALDMLSFEYSKIIFFRYGVLKNWDIGRLEKLR